MKTTGYCYHSVNVISLHLSQSNHIKQLPLYNSVFFNAMPTVDLLLLKWDGGKYLKSYCSNYDIYKIFYPLMRLD